MDGTINILIEHFCYKMNKTCSNFLQYTITILLFQSQYQVKIDIQKTMFRNLNNSCVLFFYGETLINHKPQFINKNMISINNCIISNNSGKYYFKMFYIVHSNTLMAFNIFYLQDCTVSCFFKNCIFENNNNIETMIFVIPAHSTRLITIITIFNVTFQNNRDANFLKVKYRTAIVWQRTIYITLKHTNISLNQHQNSDSIIFVNNGTISVSYSVFSHTIVSMII